MQGIRISAKTLAIGDDVYQLSAIVRISTQQTTHRLPDVVTTERSSPAGSDAVGIIFLAFLVFFILTVSLQDIGTAFAVAMVGLFVALLAPWKSYERLTPDYRPRFELVIEYSSGHTRSLVWSLAYASIQQLKASVQTAIDNPPDTGPITISFSADTYISNDTIVGGDQYNTSGPNSTGHVEHHTRPQTSAAPPPPRHNPPPPLGR